jgi:hypothetical protein
LLVVVAVVELRKEHQAAVLVALAGYFLVVYLLLVFQLWLLQLVLAAPGVRHRLMRLAEEMLGQIPHLAQQPQLEAVKEVLLEP